MGKMNGDADSTRVRLLEAAAAVFAEKGFRHATVREICKRADANVAAVNYHFRDKEELYQAVFRHCMMTAMGNVSAAMQKAARLNPRQRLGVFIHAFLGHVLSVEEANRHAAILAHEMISPTPMLSVIVEEGIRPQFNRLRQIVEEILGPQANEEDVRFSGASVISQILFHKNSRAVILRLYPDLQYDETLIAKLAEHITEFSYSGLLAVRKRIAARTAGGVR